MDGEEEVSLGEVDVEMIPPDDVDATLSPVRVQKMNDGRRCGYGGGDD